MRRVSWRKLKVGQVVRVSWDDHHDFDVETAEKDLDIYDPIPQISTGVVRKVTKKTLVIEYDHCQGKMKTGGTIIGSCITKAVVYGRIRE